MRRTLRSRVKLGRYPASIGMMLRERRERFRGMPALSEKGAGGMRTLLWEDLCLQVAQVGESLLRLGLGKGEVAAICSRNRSEMLVFELAAMSVGAVACPIFAGYSGEPLDYILEHSGARFLAVCDTQRLGVVLSTRAARNLERVFLMDPLRCPKPEKAGPRVSAFATLLGGASLSSFERALSKVRPLDPALLMYTSGTSGRPKGVLLSHRNILSQRRALDLLWKIKPGGRILSYLPWHHSFGGIFELFGALYSGTHITLDDSYGKDIGVLIENFKKVRPTIFFSVPRIHQALIEESRRSRQAERDIFHPELRFVFTAAAALPKHVAEVYQRKGVPVVEGWGLTETSPCVTVTRFDQDRRPFAVGLPIPGVTVRVAKDGEILVKGPNVMLGYYRDPERNARAFTRDGWLRTGDYGEIRGHGLVLKCRVDGMFKLTNGEMVIAQNVESALAESPLVQYAIVVGGGRDYVGALVFPNPEAVAEAARRRGLSVSAGSLLADERVRELIKAELVDASRAIVEKYARPKAAVLVGGVPCLANGQLTPTMKLVRSRILADYAPEIEAMFAPSDNGRGATWQVMRL
ncbi:MAG TPA: hypothetical protein DCZ01_12750 [Elusimicrobia bacterium]|nr:MAG: hypothetical protein A2X37_12130 [Elusimicrobia bacterium GWA2_66_18]OGR72152.1 MAG: hypothetical protein A2X40_11510 [Elusimicrobia bacterium GWC2_65_9]HAZ09356.1 hypothetical protein [Elusimicrobiota bacterium]